MDRPPDIDEPLGQYYEGRDVSILMDRQVDIDKPLGQYYEGRDGQYTHGQTIGHRRAARSVLRQP